jgi:hypothetical protein
MLNETFMLRQALRTCDFELPDVLEQPGRAPGYRVILNARGLPEDVVELSAGEMASLWTIREGKQNSFPVAKLQQAIVAIPADAPLRTEIESLTKSQNVRRIELLQTAVTDYPLALSKVTEDVFHRLREKATELLSIVGGSDAKFAALPEMFRRFGESDRTTSDLLNKLANLIVEKLKTSRLSNSTLAQQLLIGKINKKEPNKPARAEVPIVFDVSDTEYPLTVIDPQMQAHVSRCLDGRRIDPNALTGVCALTGVEQILETERFPAPNLPVLGEAYLVSMNADVPCQQRYGLTGPHVVPVGRQTTRELEKSLKFITSADLNGKTWRRVASGKYEAKSGRKVERSDLLVVYLESQPIPKVRLAEIAGVDLTDRKQRQAKQQAKFEDTAKKVCDCSVSTLFRRP